MPHIKLKLRAKIKNLPRSEKLHKLRVRLRGHLTLPCALAVGLLPPLVGCTLCAGWQMLPADIAALLPSDARPLTACALLTSPFAAGYIMCRQPAACRPVKGALPAFWLWLSGLLAYTLGIDLPDVKNASEGLFAALALGIAGGMCAQRRQLGQKKKAGE